MDNEPGDGLPLYFHIIYDGMQSCKPISSKLFFKKWYVCVPSWSLSGFFIASLAVCETLLGILLPKGQGSKFCVGKAVRPAPLHYRSSCRHGWRHSLPALSWRSYSSTCTLSWASSTLPGCCCHYISTNNPCIWTHSPSYWLLVWLTVTI